MASSSSSKPRKSYHVFLSFRGPDVRKNFLGHLYAALDRTGIYTYVDDEELRKGEQISSALMKAIEESRIAIIIFSQDYASSRWCLEELEKIMECKAQKDLIVLPVFYKVEPREVREGRESYGRAMTKHELQKDSETVNRWKKALLDAGNLSGWYLNDGDEADLVKKIVKEISKQLDRIPSRVAKHPVGLQPQVEKLKSMLNLESDDNVIMVGLWGQGGIGKTELAKALYNAIFRQFEGSCFLANVREASKDSTDLVHLQERLLIEILREKLTVYSVDGGINLLQDRLSSKRILLGLDDVNDIKQLDALVGECGCDLFGKGSRIIVTTRDNHLLTSRGLDKDLIYRVKTLENPEAFELFHEHAFRRNDKIVIRRDLVESALSYAGGLPLALKVLGSFLCDKTECEWQSALNKLAKYPDKDINGVLKLSYDGLEDYAKEIFLDIACFFKGRSTEYIIKVLDSCDFDTIIGVRVLVEKSLIIEHTGVLQMHDLIQLMGMDIVKQESRDDPGRRSRLWLCDDVRDVLSRDRGTNAVKAIVLNLAKPEHINIDPGAFTSMRRLRVLIMINVHSSFRSPVHLPNELRWFEWPESLPWNLEFSPGPKKLVGLDLHGSNIQVAREQFKDFKKLKFINFSGCQSLVNMPNLSFTPDLEELNLSGCKNLECAHESVTRLDQLRLLSLSGCSPLLSLPGELQSENLERLYLANCSKVQIFPINPNNTKCLRELNLKGTSIGELPASIGNLVHLESMNLGNCKKLSVLPSSIYRLQNLESLFLYGCSKLIKFPRKEVIESDPHMKTGFPKLTTLFLEDCNLSEVEFLGNPSCFPSLNELDLRRNNFINLPACGHLNNLGYLDVACCNQLQEIRELPREIISINTDGCKSLSKISAHIDDVEGIRLGSCYKLVENVPGIYDLLEFKRACLREEETAVCLPGGEMPEWLIPNDDGYICYVVSEDLYKKFLKLAICIVVRAKEGEQWVHFSVDGHSDIYTGTESHINWDSDHVWLLCEPHPRIKFSGPLDWRCFKVTVRALASAIVKKCGFRLICKPLGNDREVFLQHNQSFNLDLLYEVEESQMSAWEEIPSEMEDSQENEASTEEGSSHEGSQMSISEENSSETEDLQESETSREKDSSSEGNSSMAGISIEEHRYSLIEEYFRNVCPGGEIPKKFILVEDGTISFMASQKLYDKIIGLALCAIFCVEDGEKKVSFGIIPSINGQRRNALSGTLGSFDSDHVWMQFLQSNVLWGLLEGGIDFGQFAKSNLEFNLRIEVSGGTMKKLGYLIICRQLEDDLKVEVEDNQLVNLGSLCEISYKPDYSVVNAYRNTLAQLWRVFREELKADMHIEELKARDSGGEPDQRWSGECSSKTD